RAGRESIKNAITENHDASGAVTSYTVTLHQRSWLGVGPMVDVPVTVKPPFDGEHALARTGNLGWREVWPLVIEKAYRQLAGIDTLRTPQPPANFMVAFTGQPVSIKVFVGVRGAVTSYDGN